MPGTVLVVDDSRAVRRILTSALRGQSIFDTYNEAVDGRDALAAFARHPADLILCDLEMPELDGFGFLREFRKLPEHQRVPVLMLSSISECDKKVEGFALGVTDYIVKPCEPAELCARVKSYLRMKLLQDQVEQKSRELEAKNEELARIAVTDALTGLHNRRYLTDRAAEELARARESGSPLGFLVLDIDFFKRINDRLGHQQGDAVLRAVARQVAASAPAGSVVARFGGEEFVVCTRCDFDALIGVAETIRSDVAALVIEGMDTPVTVSIGASSFPRDAVESLDQLFSRADEALYAAKAAGRNRVVVAGSAEAA